MWLNRYQLAGAQLIKRVLVFRFLAISLVITTSCLANHNPVVAVDSCSAKSELSELSQQPILGFILVAETPS